MCADWTVVTLMEQWTLRQLSFGSKIKLGSRMATAYCVLQCKFCIHLAREGKGIAAARQIQIYIRRAAYLRAMIERKLETRFSFCTLAIVLHFLLVRHLYSCLMPRQAFLFSWREIPKVLELCHPRTLYGAPRRRNAQYTRRSMQQTYEKCACTAANWWFMRSSRFLSTNGHAAVKDAQMGNVNKYSINFSTAPEWWYRA